MNNANNTTGISGISNTENDVLSLEQIISLRNKLSPQNGNIIIFRDKVPTKNSSGLVIQAVQTGVKTITGTVILSDNSAVPCDVKVIFGSLSGVDFVVDGIQLTSLKRDDIIGIFKI